MNPRILFSALIGALFCVQSVFAAKAGWKFSSDGGCEVHRDDMITCTSLYTRKTEAGIEELEVAFRHKMESLVGGNENKFKLMVDEFLENNPGIQGGKVFLVQKTNDKGGIYAVLDEEAPLVPEPVTSKEPDLAPQSADVRPTGEESILRSVLKSKTDSGAMKDTPEEEGSQEGSATGSAPIRGGSHGTKQKSSGSDSRPTHSTEELLAEYNLGEFVADLWKNIKEQFDSRKKIFAKDIEKAIKAYNGSAQELKDAWVLFEALDKALTEMTGEPEMKDKHLAGFQKILESKKLMGDKTVSWLQDIASFRNAPLSSLLAFQGDKERPARKKIVEMEIARRRNSEVVKFYASGAAARSMTALSEVEEARGLFGKKDYKGAAGVLAGRYAQLRKEVREGLLKDAESLLSSGKPLTSGDRDYLNSMISSLKATNFYWDLRDQGKDHQAALTATQDWMKQKGLQDPNNVSGEVLAALGNKLQTNSMVTKWLEEAFDANKTWDQRKDSFAKLQAAYKGGENEVLDYIAQIDRTLERKDLDAATKAQLTQRRGQWAAVIARRGEPGPDGKPRWYLPIRTEEGELAISGGPKFGHSKPVIVQAANVDDLGAAIDTLNGEGRGLERLSTPVKYAGWENPYKPSQHTGYTYAGGKFAEVNFEEQQKQWAALLQKQKEQQAALEQQQAQQRAQLAQQQQQQRQPSRGLAVQPQQAGVGASGLPFNGQRPAQGQGNQTQSRIDFNSMPREQFDLRDGTQLWRSGWSKQAMAQEASKIPGVRYVFFTEGNPPTCPPCYTLHQTLRDLQAGRSDVLVISLDRLGTQNAKIPDNTVFAVDGVGRIRQFDAWIGGKSLDTLQSELR